MPSVTLQLKEHGSSLFNSRGTLMSLFQELAENFYPQRADFTTQRYLGAESSSNLMTSFPVIMRRDLANAFSAMLRNSAKDWFETASKRDKIDSDGKKFLAYLTRMMKKAMYDPVAMFDRATKEADNDFATFGQAVIQARWIRPPDGSTPHFHFQCWHLRDVAWAQNSLGAIDTVFRKWNPTAIDIVRSFPLKVHYDISDRAKTKPFDTFEIWHCVLPRDIYDSLDGAERIARAQPWVNVFFDPTHDIVFEAVGSWVMEYVIPRWETVSGSQYANSPATMAALPDARLKQAMTRVIYDAGEKAVDPPTIGVREALRSDIDIRAGGFTAVDPDYVDHLENILRPLTRDIKGFNIGPELIKDIREQLKDAFYLNKLNLPPTGGPDMTAYEVGQRVQEFIRNALPLFGPMEAEYNARLCDTILQLILHNDPEVRRSIPKSLGMGTKDDFEFVFESPLRDAVDKAKLGQFDSAQQILSKAAGLDKTVLYLIDGKVATRDVLDATVPADWLRSEDEVDQMVQSDQAAQQQQKILAMMQQGAGVAKDGAAAAADAASAMATTGPA